MNKSILTLFSVAMFLSCSNSGSLPNNGERCYIDKMCLSSVDGYFDELNKVSNRQDEYRLQEMISQGYVYVLKPHYQFTMLEKKFGKCRLRVNDSDNTFIVWVSSEFIKNSNGGDPNIH